MIDLNKVITDVEMLRNQVCYIEGFAFTSLSNIGSPANVFDAIIVRNPAHAQCFTPKLGISSRTLEEHITFINRHQISKAVIIADDIQFLEDCPSLRYLQIIPADNCDSFDYSPIYNMHNIRGLNCSTEYGNRLLKHTTVNYSRLPHILDLDIAGKGNLHTDKLTLLQQLNVSRNASQNLSEIVCSSSLTNLSLTQCGIRSLKGISCTNSLSKLSLWHNRSLTDITELAYFSKSLRQLSVVSCPKIKDFSFLNALENLEHLVLLGNNCLPNLSFLANTKKLTHFIFDMNVKNGDLTPCLSIPYVISRRNRKHYNLKNIDLPKGELRHST